MPSPSRTLFTALAGSAALTVVVGVMPVSAAPTAPAVDTRACKFGGACIIGDEGPGGGTIIAVNRKIRVTSAVVEDLFVTISTPGAHGLHPSDKVTITGANPAAFNVPEATVSGVASPNVLTLLMPQDLTGYTYIGGGLISQSVGDWDYLEAAPKGWSGSDTDPRINVPIYDGISGNLLDWRLGAGHLNTALLQGQDAAGDAFSNVVDDYGYDASQWYIPSAMEALAMYKLFGRTAADEDANGFARDLYLSSSAGSYMSGFGHVWHVADFSRNLAENPAIGIASQVGGDGGRVRPVRRVWLERDQSNVSIASKVGIGKRISFASLSPEGLPLTVKVLRGSVCTVTEPAKKNSRTSFTVNGGKKAGNCSLKISAPGNYKYRALLQLKVIAVK